MYSGSIPPIDNPSATSSETAKFILAIDLESFSFPLQNEIYNLPLLIEHLLKICNQYKIKIFNLSSRTPKTSVNLINMPDRRWKTGEYFEQQFKVRNIKIDKTISIFDFLYDNFYENYIKISEEAFVAQGNRFDQEIELLPKTNESLAQVNFIEMQKQSTLDQEENFQMGIAHQLALKTKTSYPKTMSEQRVLQLKYICHKYKNHNLLVIEKDESILSKLNSNFGKEIRMLSFDKDKSEEAFFSAIKELKLTQNDKDNCLTEDYISELQSNFSLAKSLAEKNSEFNDYTETCINLEIAQQAMFINIASQYSFLKHDFLKGLLENIIAKIHKEVSTAHYEMINALKNISQNSSCLDFKNYFYEIEKKLPLTRLFMFDNIGFNEMLPLNSPQDNSLVSGKTLDITVIINSANNHYLELLSDYISNAENPLTTNYFKEQYRSENLKDFYKDIYNFYNQLHPLLALFAMGFLYNKAFIEDWQAYNKIFAELDFPLRDNCTINITYRLKKLGSDLVFQEYAELFEAVSDIKNNPNAASNSADPIAIRIAQLTIGLNSQNLITIKSSHSHFYLTKYAPKKLLQNINKLYNLKKMHPVIMLSLERSLIEEIVHIMESVIVGNKIYALQSLYEQLEQSELFLQSLLKYSKNNPKFITTISPKIAPDLIPTSAFEKTLKEILFGAKYTFHNSQQGQQSVFFPNRKPEPPKELQKFDPSKTEGEADASKQESGEGKILR